jgi:arylsulfatase A-like enzyme
MRLTVSVLFSLALLPALFAALFAGEPTPNIVILLADDLGYGDVACNNPQSGKIKTPHIDALTAEGMRFTDAHTSSGVCSPTRYALLTGRYHWRTRLQTGIVGLFEKPLIAADRATIATLAKQNGYTTACIGKWHLGWDWPLDEQTMKQTRALGGKAGGGGKAATEAPESLREAWRKAFANPIAGGPTTRGFDLYFGTDVPNWPPYCYIENDRTLGIPTELLAANLFKNHQASLQGPALKDWRFGPILATLGDRAEKFIAEQAAAKKPFLLYLPFTAPHTPITPSEAWAGKSGLGLYADLVMETDATVGRILAALKQHNLAGNTLVVFSSDNGFASY